MQDLQKTYQLKNKEISKRLNDFKALEEDKYFSELMFCLLTPQSKAKSCWEAIQEINLLKKFDKEQIRKILAKKTRFHNNQKSDAPPRPEGLGLLALVSSKTYGL